MNNIIIDNKYDCTIKEVKTIVNDEEIETVLTEQEV